MHMQSIVHLKRRLPRPSITRRARLRRENAPEGAPVGPEGAPVGPEGRPWSPEGARERADCRRRVSVCETQPGSSDDVKR